MKLLQVAKFFDRMTFADAYVPATTLKGQFSLFDDSMRDGMTIERRILSVAPSVTIPSRRTLIADGITWLVGDEQRDYYKTAAIRHKHVLHQATELVAVKTFSEAISAAAGYAAWASRVWVKAAREVEISSDTADVFDVYFARGEPLAENTLIYMSGRWHLIRSLYPSTAGMLVALADELPEPVRTSVTLTSRTYAPTTDTYTTAATTITGLRIRWQSHFRYLSQASSKFKPGDDVLVVKKTDAATLKAGDKLTVSGVAYNIIALIDEGACWAAHMRND